MCVDCVVKAMQDKNADGAIVFDKGLSSDQTVENLLAEGWTLVDEEVVAGKRIRYLEAPEGPWEEQSSRKQT